MMIQPHWPPAAPLAPADPQSRAPLAGIAPEAAGPGALLRRPLRIGLFVIVAFGALLGGWAATAPIAGGAVAPARINPDGGVRTVQHLEGGIIRTLHVRDGDAVEEGAPLVTLETVSASADMELLIARRQALRVERARLEAESLGAAEIALPGDMRAQDPGIAALLQAQTRVLQTRRTTIETRQEMLSRRIGQLREQIAGLRAQADSAARQTGLVREEFDAKTSLLAKGLIAKSEVLQLDRTIAGLEGARAGHLAEIARAEQEIDETRLEVLALDAEHAAEIAERAAEIRLELEEIARALETHGDILRRAVVVAPEAGVVADLRVNTIGGVLAAGAPILDIVPVAETLTVDARVTPADIDLLALDDTAIVTLTAFSGRDAPRLTGTVTAIAADALRDAETGHEYYPVRVEIPPDQLDRVPAGLVSGMRAEVMIVARARTLVAYLLEPFGTVLRRGLREI